MSLSCLTLILISGALGLPFPAHRITFYYFISGFAPSPVIQRLVYFIIPLSRIFSCRRIELVLSKKPEHLIKNMNAT